MSSTKFEDLSASILSGCFAATAGIIGKVALSSESTLLQQVPENFEIAARVALFGTVILCNILMIRYFVHSLHTLGSSKATVINFSVNYLISIIVGYALFEEMISIKKLAGIVLMMTGVVLIATCKTYKKQDEEKKEKKD